MRLFPLLVVALCACAPEEADPTSPATGTAGTEPAVNPYGSVQNCPVFEEGTITTRAGGVDRSIEIRLPDEPRGAPVVLAWHWLGSNANELLTLMQIGGLADDGYLVVAPETSGLPYEWDSFDPSDGNVDLQLVDKLLPCLYDQYAIDPDRVYATGMSAGGLFTTFLTMHRADVLAGTAIFSGGTSAATYTAPDPPIASMVTWGGPTDEYYGFDFHQPSLDFVDLLLEDGSWPIACEHALGHLPPFESPAMLRSFFEDHRHGEPSPWFANGLPSGMPAFCDEP